MNYTEIIDMALNYSDRVDDAFVSSRMDMFMKIVESRFNRYISDQQQVKESTTPLVDGQYNYDLPPDYASTVTLSIESIGGTGIVAMEYIPSKDYFELLNANKGESSPSSQYSYTLSGDQIKLVFAPDANYATVNQIFLVYKAKIAPLNSTDSTNWVSENFPDLYIFGLLVEINAFLKDAATASLWLERFNSTLDEMADKDNKYLWDGPQIVTKVR